LRQRIRETTAQAILAAGHAADLPVVAEPGENGSIPLVGGALFPLWFTVRPLMPPRPRLVVIAPSPAVPREDLVRFGRVLADVAADSGMKVPGYTVGVKFAMPIENRAARGNLSVARANLRSSELSLRDQELSIILQVRTAVRNVEATEKGVKAAEKTRYFQERTLDAEKKKFENGMSTNFIVLQDMTNLDNARSAEVQAQVNYANAVTALESAVGNLLEARKLTVK